MWAKPDTGPPSGSDLLLVSDGVELASAAAALPALRLPGHAVSPEPSGMRVLSADIDLDGLAEAIRAVMEGAALPDGVEAVAADGTATHSATDRLIDGLSPREHDVLGWLVAGARNDAIAHALGVSVNTVRTHVARILDKLGVDSRFEAATLAMREGVEPATGVDG
jgi:DNA-binding CsgD family transcriptional regulator